MLMLMLPRRRWHCRYSCAGAAGAAGTVAGAGDPSGSVGSGRPGASTGAVAGAMLVNKSC